jgi:hypothetical protein
VTGQKSHPRLSLTLSGWPGGTIFIVSALIHFGMHLLTILFFIGLAGSAIVIIISFIEDLQELFGE